MDFPISAPGRKVSVIVLAEEITMKSIAKIVLALLLAFAAAAVSAQEKVVYHFDSGIEQATKGLRNIYNHLEADPKVKIIAVTHADGVDFLMEGAKDRLGPFDARVQDLMGHGVEFQVCEITMRLRNLKKDQFILGVQYVRSGVAQITHLQQKEGFAYLKP
jgi:intracellular sulfur oxidation DsrE/DsrF family protein